MSDGGHGLLWTLPWSGLSAEKLALADLDPFYIEVCERVRLFAEGTRLRALVAPALQSTRIEDDDAKGVVGDLWLMVNRPKKGQAKALSLMDGFTPRRLLALLGDPAWERPELLRITPFDAAFAETESKPVMYLTGRAVIGGQGKTERCEEFCEPFDWSAASRLFGSSEKERAETLAVLSERREATDAVAGALWGALKHFSDGRDENDAIAVWRDKFRKAAETAFFADMQVEESQRARVEWLDGVIEIAEATLAEACAAMPRSSTRFARLAATTNLIFQGGLRNADALKDHWEWKSENKEPKNDG